MLMMVRRRKQKEAGYKILQGQREGVKLQMTLQVAKDILSEKLIFESKECEGASFADRWGRVFTAALNTKVLRQTMWPHGMLGNIKEVSVAGALHSQGKL